MFYFRELESSIPKVFCLLNLSFAIFSWLLPVFTGHCKYLCNFNISLNVNGFVSFFFQVYIPEHLAYDIVYPSDFIWFRAFLPFSSIHEIPSSQFWCSLEEKKIFSLILLTLIKYAFTCVKTVGKYAVECLINISFSLTTNRYIAFRSQFHTA